MLQATTNTINSTSASKAARRGPVVAFERHFTTRDLAELWKFDETRIRRIFQDEPGVLKVGRSNRRDGKRDYVTLRIPESVALRIYQERTR